MTEAIRSSDAWIHRYLGLLGERHRAPSLEALASIVGSHLRAVPFENVTSLLRLRDHPAGDVPAPDPDALLAAWERRAGGGVCFELVPMLSRLLGGLGYETHTVLGQISLPYGHQALIVTLGERRFLVDVGNGSPFFEPIPIDALPYELHRFGLSYRFYRGAHEDELLQDRWIDGSWTTYCRYDLRPAADSDREHGYQHHHVPNASWVTGTLTMVRCTEDAVYALRDDSLTHYTAQGKRMYTIADADACRKAVIEIYGLTALDIDGALAMRRMLAQG